MINPTERAKQRVLAQRVKTKFTPIVPDMANARVIGNFIYSGLLDRHPTLKIVSVESGIGCLCLIVAQLQH